MNPRTLASGSRTCPVCGRTDERLPRHWTSEACSWPDVTRCQHDFVIGLLPGNATISGDSANKLLRLATTNRTFATWVFEELGWLADSLVRVDPPNHGSTEHAVNHCYRVRTRTHPELTTYCEWYDASGEKRVPLHLDLPARSARVWYACSGELHWQSGDDHPSAVFNALNDKRATRIAGLVERAEFEPTRTGTQVRLPPRETRAFLKWIGDPVPGVGYKWATERAIYDDLRREQRAERWWLALHPERETRLRPTRCE